jgi:hypothetical protein
MLQQERGGTVDGLRFYEVVVIEDKSEVLRYGRDLVHKCREHRLDRGWLR